MGTGNGLGRGALMFPFPNPFDLFGAAAGGIVGWAWDKVIQGIYTWLANGLALLIEWVWSVLDSGTTPRVTAGWFRNDLAGRVGLIGLATTIAMMLLSAAQAALAGRPVIRRDRPCAREASQLDPLRRTRHRRHLGRVSC